MITFIDLGPVATVHLYVRVMVPLKAGGWTWGELPALAGVMAREFAYTAEECASLVHTYGRTVGRIKGVRELGDRFSVVAKGPKTGMTLGIREWEWSSSTRDYRRAGEYLCGWREAVKALYRQTGELMINQKFESRPAGLPLVVPDLNGPEWTCGGLPGIPAQCPAPLAA